MKKPSCVSFIRCFASESFFVMNARIIRAAGTNILSFDFSDHIVTLIMCRQGEHRSTPTMWNSVVRNVRRRVKWFLELTYSIFLVKRFNIRVRIRPVRSERTAGLVWSVMSPHLPECGWDRRGWGWWEGSYRMSWVVIWVLQEQEGVRPIPSLAYKISPCQQLRFGVMHHVEDWDSKIIIYTEITNWLVSTISNGIFNQCSH